MDYKALTFNDIYNWCVTNKQTAWLKETGAVKENGKRPTFIEIKKAFALKFMPEIMPKAQPKAPTMYDLIDSL